MVSQRLYLTFADDGEAQLPNAASCNDHSRIALSLSDLRGLKTRLREQGGSLRQFLATRRRVQLRFLDEAAQNTTELFEDSTEVATAVSEELQARRQYLKKRAEERAYANLIASVQQDEIKERNRESFASYRQQASIGMSFLIGLLTAVLAGYLIGRVYGNGQHAWLFSLVAGIVMLFVDAVLVILRLSQLDKQEAKRAKDEAQRPLGVRLGTKPKQLPSRSTVPSLAGNALDTSPSSPQGRLPHESESDPLASLAAAQRAFDNLVNTRGGGEPSEASSPTSSAPDSTMSPQNPTAQDGIRRRIRRRD